MLADYPRVCLNSCLLRGVTLSQNRFSQMRALASNFFQTVITPMPIEYFLHFKPLSTRELKGLSEFVKKIGKNKPKCQKMEVEHKPTFTRITDFQL